MINMNAILVRKRTCLLGDDGACVTAFPFDDDDTTIFTFDFGL